MTLIEEIDESIRLGDAFGNNTNLSEILSDAESLLKCINESERDIISLFQDAKNMKAAELISGDEILSVLEILYEVRIDISEKNEYRVKYFKNASKNTKEISDRIKEVWSRYLLKAVGTQRDIIETLRILINDSQRYNTLVNLYKSIVNYPYPGDRVVFEKIDQYKDLTDKLVKELNLQQSVWRFFERMAEKKVLSLGELTPEIWNWIQKNNFEDKFTIKISVNNYC